jgi:hypothetical protein
MKPAPRQTVFLAVSAPGSSRTNAMIAAAVQWAERILRKIDNVFSG